MADFDFAAEYILKSRTHIPPPAPELIDIDEEEESSQAPEDAGSQKGQRAKERVSTSTSGKKRDAADLRRVLGGRRQRNSNHRLVVKNTISENRTGDNQQQLLLALDKGTKDRLLGIHSSSSTSESALQLPEGPVNEVILRTGASRPDARRVLRQFKLDIDSAVWFLEQPPADAERLERVEARGRAAKAYIEATRKRDIAKTRFQSPRYHSSTGKPKPASEESDSSQDYGWVFKPSEIANSWRNGMIMAEEEERVSGDDFYDYTSVEEASAEDSASRTAEPYCPLYETLVDRASQAGIDVSGSPESSVIICTLLDSIHALEQLREKWNRALKTGSAESIDWAPYRSRSRSAWQNAEFYLELDLDYYGDGFQSELYTKLLGVHSKLQYEIGFLERWYITTYESPRARDEVLRLGPPPSKSRPERHKIRRHAYIEDSADEDLTIRRTPPYERRHMKAEVRLRPPYVDSEEEKHSIPAQPQRRAEREAVTISRRGVQEEESSSEEYHYDRASRASTRLRVPKPPDAPAPSSTSREIVRYKDNRDRDESEKDRPPIVIRQRSRDPVRRRQVPATVTGDRSPVQPVRVRSPQVSSERRYYRPETFSDSEGPENPESDNYAIEPHERLDWILIKMGTDRTTSLGRLEAVFEVKRHTRKTGFQPQRGTFDIDDELDKRPGMAFVIERQYDAEYLGPGSTAWKSEPVVRQSITYLCANLMDALEPLVSPSATRIRGIPNTMAWDLLLFHGREQIIALLDTLDKDTRAQMQMLLDATEEDSNEATTLFAEGTVTARHLCKLFTWNAVIVVPGELVETHLCRREPIVYDPRRTSVSLEVSRWFFDGKMYLTHSEMTIQCPRVPTKIVELRAYPLKYAAADVQELVARRGRAFWACRRKAYISYTAPDQIQRSQGPGNYRYMIDYNTYRELHPDAEEFTTNLYEDTVMLPDDAMDKDEPPGGGQELIFPPRISWYSIQDKKWKTLRVDYIQPVTWNTLAFERLVLKPVAKELIQAVVQNNDSPEGSADLMQGKGNGSLILLHGPPGTGKTLTAESVAELVQRPLYRVTCGDVGTDPEAVENYLESVLYIGKIWGCVVLLDEADVFLEERTLTDLHRNALVSVFLRVLEYYDGILILTSNRVGTFDEAFKLRIKLALHYSALAKADRRKVWRNFFKALKETDPERVDFDDLDDHLDDLADVVLNGRDIRNAISVARELARFRKDEKLDYHHLQHVIGVADDFEKYLDKTHGHKTDDWLKENGIRG